MKSYKQTLKDVIECSWWPNEGPVLLRRPVVPFEDDVAIVLPLRSAPSVVKARVLIALGWACYADGETAGTLAHAISEDLRVVTGALNTLQAEGAIERFGRGTNNAGKWRLRRAEEAEAAE